LRLCFGGFDRESSDQANMLESRDNYLMAEIETRWPMKA
jgi:hypothetical protein